jgi:hypothetical protein
MKISLTVAQQMGAFAAKFDEAFNRNDAGGVAAFFTEDAVRETPQGASRFLPAHKPSGRNFALRRGFLKSAQTVGNGRLAVVQ